MKIKVVVEIEAPEGATHYAGPLLEDPTWWKFLTNSTGAIQVWCYWSESKQEWLVQSEREPLGLKVIEEVRSS